MSEPARVETQLGIAEFKRRLGVVGLSVIDEHEQPGHQSFYFAVGNAENQTDIVLSREFLDDLLSTKPYQSMVDAYAHAVAGRLKCGSPEVFYCLSGSAVQVSIQWPFHSGIYQNTLSVVVLMVLIEKVNGKIAKCSMEIGRGKVFDVVTQTVNSARSAIDAGKITFYAPDFHQEAYQRIERQQQPQEHQSQPQVEKFIAGKAYVLGFVAADESSDVWTADPWDAQYLGVTLKELSLGARVLRAKGLVDSGSAPDYVRPTDKLLAEHSAETKHEETILQSPQTLSRSTLPKKEDLLKDITSILKQHPISAIVVIDLDHFKKVNDTRGHLEGDACLDRVVVTIGVVVGRKGKIYRWGGDEFALCLPDFSSQEAQATAERIRCAVEEGRPGQEVAVTTSIGVCGTDVTAVKSAEEFLDFADKAMYESKRTGKNRVTAWPLSPGTGTEYTPTKRLDEEERRKLAESVVLTIKSDTGHERNYTIRIKNHSKEFDVGVKRISLWSNDQRVGEPIFRPEGTNAKCWDVSADRELTISFDVGEVVAKRLWSIAGAPSMTVFHDTNLLLGHFRSTVRVEVLYDVLGIEKQYDETRTVQVDPINNAVTGT